MTQTTNDPSLGPVATEMIHRLTEGLSPSHLELINESDHHIGHAGHDGSGESHFRLIIEAEAFAGRNRVQRQRLVYRALGDLMDAKVHALSMKATAPGE